MWFSHHFSFDWWEDAYLFDSLNVFTSHLFFKEKNEILKLNNPQNSISDLIFDHFKTKGIVSDKSSNSHPVWMDVRDTDDAKIFCDEITCYKGASLFNYLYSLIGERFWSFLSSLLNSHEQNGKFITSEEFLKTLENFDNHSSEENTTYTASTEDTTLYDILSPANQMKYHLRNHGMSRLRCV